ncbi:MAG: PAS domain-containing protein [Gammaproteobacteria bacterium]
MLFDVRKDTGIIPHVLTQILDCCVNGVTLSDPDLEDNPIVYANKVFEDITGYSREEIIGKNCRFLQNGDRDQEAIKKIHEALEKRTSVEVTLRNYRKNGEMFYNRLAIKPLFDKQGNVIYFLGLQYDITDQVNARSEIEALNQKLELAIDRSK